MKIGYLIGAAVETIIKVVVLAAVVILIFRGATKAYDFGYRVFADEPVSLSGGRTITVGISENMSVKDIAQMLEEKGLIEDAKLFVVQELLSAYHDEIIPGIYDLSTTMTAGEMLAVMATPLEESEDQAESAPAGNAGEESGEEADGDEADEGDGSEDGES